MFDFSNRVVMITGASGNLGSALGRAYQEAGARLALVDRRQDLLHEQFPEWVDSPDCYMSGSTDLTKLEDVANVVKTIMAHFGRLDMLVNTVGGFRAGIPLHETSVDTWDFMINLNARTAFLTSQCVIPQMIRQGSGKIIHLAARPGLEGRANMAAYSASKAAVIRLTESISAEVKEHGINVNCILPGTLDTPQNRQSMPEADYNQWVAPASLANIIMFLTSEAARDIHGAAIPVYGLT